MSRTLERPVLTTEAKLDRALKTLRFYANSDNYEPELIGETPDPGSEWVLNDAGYRARKALKELRS